MLFWASVLVFIASILTYFSLPIGNVYMNDVHQDEAAIASFVNQHQAARDYMSHVITLKDASPFSENNPSLKLIPYYDLESFMPRANKRCSNNNGKDERCHDIYGIWKTENDKNNYEGSLNPNPNNIDADGHYTSAVVCLDDKQRDIVECKPGSKRFVITYGFMPDWWSSKTDRRGTWRNAILLKTRGSVSCGSLYAPENSEIYSIDTGKELSGTLLYKESHGGFSKERKIIPTVITRRLADIMNRKFLLPPKEDLQDETGGVLFCMSPVYSPYRTNGLVYMIDKINPKGEGFSSDKSVVFPLVKAEAKVIFGPEYTLEGVVSLAEKTSNDLVKIIEDNAVNSVGYIGFKCTKKDKSSDYGCHFVIQDAEEHNGGEFVVGDKFSFSFLNRKNELKLYINGHVYNLSLPDRVINYTSAKIPSDQGNVLQHLRIYNDLLDEQPILRNFRTDQRRFGINTQNKQEGIQ